MIELLVVIVIIGILAAVAIGVTLNQRKKANYAAAQSDMRRVVMEVESQLVDHPNARSVEGEVLASGDLDGGTDSVLALTIDTGSLPLSPSGFGAVVDEFGVLSIQTPLSPGVYGSVSGNPNSVDGYEVVANHLNSGRENLIYKPSLGSMSSSGGDGGLNEREQCEALFGEEMKLYNLGELSRGIAFRMSTRIPSWDVDGDAPYTTVPLKNGNSDPNSTSFEFTYKSGTYTVDKPAGLVVSSARAYGGYPSGDTDLIFWVEVSQPETGLSTSGTSSMFLPSEPQNNCG